MSSIHARATVVLALLALLLLGNGFAEQAKPASAAVPSPPQPQATTPDSGAKEARPSTTQADKPPKLSAEAQAKELDRLRKAFEATKQQFAAQDRPSQNCGSTELVKLLDDLWALRTTQKAQGTTDTPEAKEAKKFTYELREAIVKARDRELGVVGHRMVAGKGHMTREHVLADNDK